MRIGDPVWLRGAKKGGEPFELGQVTNVQQNGARVTVADASGAERAFDAANADVFISSQPGGEHRARPLWANTSTRQRARWTPISREKLTPKFLRGRVDAFPPNLVNDGPRVACVPCARPTLC